MYRHIRISCKIANTEEGMEKLMEHTLVARFDQQCEQIRQLTSLVEKMVTTPPVNTITTNINNNNNNVTINITPWDGEYRITTSAEQIAAAFLENGELKKYLNLDDAQRVDPEVAPPYVETFLVDQTRRAHEDPAARNVYLNPKRADQAMVFAKNGRWEILTLTEAIRGLNDHLMKVVKQIAKTPEELRKLTLDVQNAIGLMTMIYTKNPEEYVKRVKAATTAHLTNMAKITDCST